MTEFGELFDETIVTRNNVIVCHLLHNREALEAWQLLRDAGQHTLVYDIDDNIWAWEEGSEHAEYWTRERQEIAENMIRLSHLVTTPSEVIAHVVSFKLALNTNVAVLPNFVPAYALDIERSVPKVFTVGYQGAPQRIHQSDLDIIQTELYRFMHVCKDARLVFYGQPKPLEGAGPYMDRVDFVPWQPSIPEYYRSLHGMTVGIGPLRKSPFTSAKSGLRAVEFASLGIPGIYSDSPPYRPFVRHRETGYLVAQIGDWRKYLIKLYRSPELVERLSKQARNTAREWTTEHNAWRWAQAYSRSGPGAPATSA